MKLEILDLELDQFDFRDRYGQFQTTRGCSMLGRSQFVAYIEQAVRIIESTELDSLALLYEQEAGFRHCCDRALELNGINPESLDCNGQLLRALLFGHDNGPGMLVRVNMVKADDKEPSPSGDEPESSTEAMMAASILAATNSLKEAMDALNHPDGKLMLAMMKARSEAMKEADAIAKGKDPTFAKWKKELIAKGPLKIDTAKLREQAFMNEKP